jgi:hypothetical protein
MRRNEMTSAVLDKTYPHQVALPDKACMGALYTAIQEFTRNLSMARRTHTIVKDDRWYVVFCFAVEADAKAFCDTFSGESFNPKTRGRGARWHLVRKGKA